jgi:hypothetical protein
LFVGRLFAVDSTFCDAGFRKEGEGRREGGTYGYVFIAHVLGIIWVIKVGDFVPSGFDLYPNFNINTSSSKKKKKEDIRQTE